MLDNDCVAFCKAENIQLFPEPVTLICKTVTHPNAMGLMIGFRDEKIALSMGPEIRVIFLVSITHLLTVNPSIAELRKLE